MPMRCRRPLGAAGDLEPGNRDARVVKKRRVRPQLPQAGDHRTPAKSAASQLPVSSCTMV